MQDQTQSRRGFLGAILGVLGSCLLLHPKPKSVTAASTNENRKQPDDIPTGQLVIDESYTVCYVSNGDYVGEVSFTAGTGHDAG